MLSVQPYSNNIINNQNSNVSFQAKRLRLSPTLRESEKDLTCGEKFLAKIVAVVNKLGEPTVYVPPKEVSQEACKKAGKVRSAFPRYPLLEKLFMWPAIKYSEFLEKQVKKSAEKAKKIQ